VNAPTGTARGVAHGTAHGGAPDSRLLAAFSDAALEEELARRRRRRDTQRRLPLADAISKAWARAQEAGGRVYIAGSLADGYRAVAAPADARPDETCYAVGPHGDYQAHPG
jgi:DNA-binding IclR family transcriptional regulator